MDVELFDYSPIVERKPVQWPGGARVAFYVGLNIEHYQVDKPATSIFQGTAHRVPDPLNYGWRDYGPRVGFWRILESFDRHNIPVSALLNSAVAEHHPQIIKAGVDRDWAWLAHGRDNSTFQGDVPEGEERAYLTDVVETIERATGKRPRGWMGPGLSETFQTPGIIKDLGLQYVLDWTNDDQPYALNVPGLLSLPYSVELNDIMLFLAFGMTGPDFLQLFKDQVDTLYAESADSGRVMALALHPFVIGQAFRAKYLDLALEYVANHEGIWLTTSDAIAEHHLAAQAG